MKPRCGNCHNWHERTDVNTTDGIPAGECRLRAPVVHGDDEPAWGVWPLTKEDEACTVDWIPRPKVKVGKALVKCTTCMLRKKPIGRSASPAVATGYCDHDCPGYLQEPLPDNLWPGEESAPE